VCSEASKYDGFTELGLFQASLLQAFSVQIAVCSGAPEYNGDFTKLGLFQAGLLV